MDITSDNIEGWSDGESSGDGKKPGNKGDRVSLFMKLEERKDTYRIRLVRRISKFRKHFDAFKPLGKMGIISPAYNKDTEKDLDVAWSKGNWCPRKRGALLVIDREHPGGLRLLEVGEQLYGTWRNFAEKVKVDPCNPDKAPDWIISVEKGDNNQIGYKTFPDPVGAAPLTAEERAMIQNFKYSIAELEEKFYKKATSEEIRELWESLPEDKKVAKKKDGKDGDNKKSPSVSSAQKSTQTTSSSTPAAKPAASEDAVSNDDADTQNSPPEGDEESAGSLF